MASPTLPALDPEITTESGWIPGTDTDRDLVRRQVERILASPLFRNSKRFPAFVLTPGADHFYRVQVGPYPNAQSANIARKKLEAQGFKSIIKR